MSDAGTPPAAGRPKGGDDASATTERVAAVPAGGATAGPDRARRRRRWIVAGVSVAAALLVLAICGGLVAALSAVDRVADEARDDRDVASGQETACLELEERLNRVSPPGAAPDPARRATAIREENEALRPYLAEVELRSERWREDDDARLAQWRQLLDARTAYADALDRQAATRVPAFFANPRTAEGGSLADRLERVSPEACAGPVRRLAAPDL